MSILDSSPTIVRCKFTDNSGSSGGGVTIKAGLGLDPSEPLFVNCQFIENLSYCYGGGMLVSANSSVTVVNSVFYLNDLQGQYQGAGFATLTTTLTSSLINCVFVGNIAAVGGGGVHSHNGTIEMNNCILWDNDPVQISIGVEGLLTIDYSCIQDSWAGTLNISSNPLFVDLVGGDYRLTSSSPCIDRGNPDDSIITDDFLDLDNDGDTTEATPDLDLNNRVSSRDNNCDKIVDMGVFEVLEGCCPWDLDGDGAVSTMDLLDLFAAWGSDPGGPPDFDCNGAVGTTDLLELFANWGACPCPPSSTPLSFEDELADACISQAEWDDYEDTMQNGTQAEKDNYDCWMRHWIEDCDRCSCLGQSGCPGADPFS